MKRVGVVMAGCGFLDGAEIQEAVATLLALDKRGVEVVNMAPNIAQMHVVNHVNQSEAEYTRNVLIESARIARGDIVDLETVDISTLDAVIFPGGFGAAKNLCEFAVKGVEMTVLPQVESMVKGCFDAGKPMGFICIAPVIAARVLGQHAPGVELTIGNDEGTASAIEHMGARHVKTEPGEIHIDQTRKVVSTPAYMMGPSIAPVFAGIDACVEAVLELC